MSNFVMNPIPKDWEKDENFRFLVAIRNPVWYSKNPLGRELVDKSFIKGSVCWTNYVNSDCILIRGHQVNYDPSCFKEISLEDIEIKDGSNLNWISYNNKIRILTGDAEEDPEFLQVFLKDCKISYKGSLDTKENYPVTPKEAFESKYRFKTEDEFKRDGLWDYYDGVPKYWNSRGQMNHYIGKPVDSACNTLCHNKERITICDKSNSCIWTFRPEDYVLNDFEKDAETISKIIKSVDPLMNSASSVFPIGLLKKQQKKIKNKTESYTFTKSKNIVI